MEKEKFSVLTLLSGLLFSLSVFSQSQTIKGTITDPAGAPVAGANVTVVGSKNGVVTSPDGSFQIKANTDGKLLISMIGFAATEVTIGGKTEITITLEKNTQQLNEVVVTALGIRRDKRNLTYSTQEVKGDELIKAKEPNVVNALAGKVWYGQTFRHKIRKIWRPGS